MVNIIIGTHYVATGMGFTPLFLPAFLPGFLIMTGIERGFLGLRVASSSPGVGSARPYWRDTSCPPAHCLPLLLSGGHFGLYAFRHYSSPRTAITAFVAVSHRGLKRGAASLSG